MKKSSAQLDREIAEALSQGSSASSGSVGSRTADGRTPLYGHTSEATAYLVDDYPYGFRMRCKIRYWLEFKKGKGWRFVSQTTNPKSGDRWNKPKASTYAMWGAAMYLDDKGHVQWTGVGPYTGERLLAFVTAFPGADMSELRKVVPEKVRLASGLASGRFVWTTTVNGVKQPVSDAEAARRREEASRELAVWEEINVYLDRAA